MLNSLHLKRSDDCNLNLITVGKLNTENMLDLLLFIYNVPQQVIFIIYTSILFVLYLNCNKE
jgi:hypothetical protein